MSTCEHCGEAVGDEAHACAAAFDPDLRATRTDSPGAGERREAAAAPRPSRAGRTTSQLSAQVSPGPMLVDLEQIPPDEEHDPLIGTLLGETYRIIERLGAGGMGTVYLVTHIHLKKKFAAKILNADTAQRPDGLARFQQEAVSASKLDHDNIVDIVNFGHSDDGTVYLIMEFLRGEALNQILAKGPLGVEDAIRIGVPITRGLGAAHGAGIVHRDLKPENVFVSRRAQGRNVVKLLDFGISKIKELHITDRRLTQTGDVLGSPLYMSPEASRGDDEVDSRADIYAVGVMLYEMVTGQVPFTAENYLQILYKHISEPPPRVRDVVPELPEAFEAVVLKALAKDPAERFQRCDELEAALIASVPGVDLEAPVSAAAPYVSTSMDMALPAGTTPLHTPRPMPAARPAVGTPAGLKAAESTPRAAGASASGPGIGGGAAASGPRVAGAAVSGPRGVDAAAGGSGDGGGTGMADDGDAAVDAMLAGGATGIAPGPPARTSRVAIVVGFLGTLAILGYGGYALWQLGARSEEHAVVAAPGAGTAVAPQPVVPGAPVAPPAPDQAAGPAVSGERAAPVEAAKARMELSVATSPAGASVTLDGQPIGQAPLTTWVAPDGAEHELRVELAGWRTETRAVIFDRSRAVEVALRRAARKEPAKPTLDIKEGR